MHKSTVLISVMVLIGYSNIYAAQGNARAVAAKQRAYERQARKKQEIRDAQPLFGRMGKPAPSHAAAIKMLAEHDRTNGSACSTLMEIQRDIPSHSGRQRKDNQSVLETDDKIVIPFGALSEQEEQTLRDALRQARIQSERENERALPTNPESRSQSFKQLASRTWNTSENMFSAIFPQHRNLLSNLQANKTKLDQSIKALQTQQKYKYPYELCKPVENRIKQTTDAVQADLKTMWDLTYQKYQEIYPQSSDFSGVHLSSIPGDQCDQLPRLLKCIIDYNALQKE
jgi:hypothetical protein